MWHFVCVCAQVPAFILTEGTHTHTHWWGVCEPVWSVVCWRVFGEQISLTVTAPKQYRFGN